MSEGLILPALYEVKGDTPIYRISTTTKKMSAVGQVSAGADPILIVQRVRTTDILPPESTRDIPLLQLAVQGIDGDRPEYYYILDTTSSETSNATVSYLKPLDMNDELPVLCHTVGPIQTSCGVKKGVVYGLPLENDQPIRNLNQNEKVMLIGVKFGLDCSYAKIRKLDKKGKFQYEGYIKESELVTALVTATFPKQTMTNAVQAVNTDPVTEVVAESEELHPVTETIPEVAHSKIATGTISTEESRPVEEPEIHLEEPEIHPVTETIPKVAHSKIATGTISTEESRPVEEPSLQKRVEEAVNSAKNVPYVRTGVSIDDIGAVILLKINPDVVDDMEWMENFTTTVTDTIELCQDKNWEESELSEIQVEMHPDLNASPFRELFYPEGNYIPAVITFPSTDPDAEAKSRVLCRMLLAKGIKALILQ